MWTEDGSQLVRLVGDIVERMGIFDDILSRLSSPNRERKEAERSGNKAWSRAVKEERKAVFAGFA